MAVHYDRSPSPHLLPQLDAFRRLSGASAFLELFTRSSPAALRKASLMRLCQPGPVLRKYPNTSASSRRLTASFGLADLGLPRRTILSTRKRSARSNHSLVRCGA